MLDVFVEKAHAISVLMRSAIKRGIYNIIQKDSSLYIKFLKEFICNTTVRYDFRKMPMESIPCVNVIFKWKTPPTLLETINESWL